MITRQQRAIDFLAEMGLRKVESKSKKYVQFLHPRCGYYYYVGKNGAVRSGHTIGDSISVTDAIWAKINRKENELQTGGTNECKKL